VIEPRPAVADDPPTALARLWFKNAVWVGALFAAIAAVAMTVSGRLLPQPSNGSSDVETFFITFFCNEAVTVIPMLLLSRALRHDFVSKLGHDLKLLKATMAGAIIGMLSPYVYWGVSNILESFELARHLVDHEGTGIVAEKKADLSGAYVLLFVIMPVLMLITTGIGSLVGWVIGQIIFGTKRPSE